MKWALCCGLGGRKAIKPESPDKAATSAKPLKLVEGPLSTSKPLQVGGSISPVRTPAASLKSKPSRDAVTPTSSGGNDQRAALEPAEAAVFPEPLTQGELAPEKWTPRGLLC